MHKYWYALWTVYLTKDQIREPFVAIHSFNGYQNVNENTCKFLLPFSIKINCKTRKLAEWFCLEQLSVGITSVFGYNIFWAIFAIKNCVSERFLRTCTFSLLNWECVR